MDTISKILFISLVLIYNQSISNKNIIKKNDKNAKREMKIKKKLLRYQKKHSYCEYKTCSNLKSEKEEIKKVNKDEEFSKFCKESPFTKKDIKRRSLGISVETN